MVAKQVYVLVVKQVYVLATKQVYVGGYVPMVAMHVPYGCYACSPWLLCMFPMVAMHVPCTLYDPMLCTVPTTEVRGHQCTSQTILKSLYQLLQPFSI